MSYTEIIDTLIQSYTSQREWYKELHIIVQKILGQMVLSRGDLSGVMHLFKQKQRLLEAIQNERERVKNESAVWQKEKDQIPASESTHCLNTILTETEEAIKVFLETEDQLQKYIEHCMAEKGNSSTA